MFWQGVSRLTQINFKNENLHYKIFREDAIKNVFSYKHKMKFILCQLHLDELGCAFCNLMTF